jgi:hypothetical protein
LLGKINLLYLSKQKLKHMKQYLVINYQHEMNDSFIVNDLEKFIVEYNGLDEDDKDKIKEGIEWLLDRNESDHEVYEVIDGKLVLLSK